MKGIFTIALVLVMQSVFSQEVNSNSWLKKLEAYKIQPIIGIQLWSSYTHDTEIFNEVSGRYEAVDNRLNFQIRRARLGIKGQAYKNLKFNFTSSLDLVGRDVLAATQGGGNNGSSPKLRLWNAYVQWKVLNKRDGLHLTVGYMSAQIGRENITSAFRVSSIEKSWSQNYLRRQLVGTGPGRALGLNLGGLFLKENKKLGWSYDLGIFNPVFHSLDGNSVGEKFSLLFVGRATVYFGDAESNHYTTSHKINYFGKRKGLSIAVSGASQAQTEIFESQKVVGIDWLLNWGNINFDGEWIFMTRKGKQLGEHQNTYFDVSSNTAYLRISYNVVFKNNQILEPVWMMVQFNGALDASTQQEASSVGAFAGKDYSYDIGLNYYFNPDLKLSLHYIWRNADAGEALEGIGFNNYYYQDGVGAIKRGNWLGLGIVAIF